MNEQFARIGMAPADILLPRSCDMTKWAVVACDQFTSQPEYWEEVDRMVGDAPSTLRLILPESKLNDPDVELVFVGGGWQYYPAQLLEQAKEILGERLVVTGPLSYEESAAYLASGDVLINLGNGVDNQVPSKLFEYFAQGKPILHLAKLANDPCLPYLNRWPLALCLSEQQGCSPEVLGQLSEFLHSKAQERIPFAQAEEIFFENTQKAAVNHILCALED